MDKSHVWLVFVGCAAHMVLVAVFLFLGQHLGQHLRLEDSILARTTY